jgi:hypothetical protein
MKLSFDITDSYGDIENKLLGLFRDRLNDAFRRARPAIRKRIQVICDSLIKGSDEYESLRSGRLLGELGIPDVEARLQSILTTIKKSVAVTVTPVTIAGNKLVGGMNVGILKDSFADILGLPASSYVSSGRYLIPWLQWLLIDGDQILVYTHEITFDLNTAQRARSRTGMALMRPGQGWRVPPRYSGTIDDNLLTRAFSGSAVSDMLATIIQEEIQKRV